MISEAEIRSMETALTELGQRIVMAGDGLRDTPADGVSVDLYEAERHLRSARRRLSDAAENLAANSL